MEYDNVISDPKNFVLNSKQIIQAEIEKNRKLTEYFLDKYFIKSTNGKYYYKDVNNIQYYDIIYKLKSKFDEDILNLAKKHKYVNIRMIDYRDENIKMMLAKNLGYFMDDLDFTVFDFFNNIILLKYEDNKDKMDIDLKKCMFNTFQVLDSNRDMDTVDVNFFKGELSKAKILNLILDNNQKSFKKSLYKDIRLNNTISNNNTILIYVGCQIILETDISWLNFFKDKFA